MPSTERQRIEILGWKRCISCFLVAVVISDLLVVSDARRDAFFRKEQQVSRPIHHERRVPPQKPLDFNQDPDIYLRLRGGSDSDEISMESPEESSVVLTKIRNIIRSVLEIGERKVPSLAKPLRSALKMLESMLGVELLPKTPKKKKKKSKKSKAKKAKEADAAILEESENKEAKPKAKKPTAATAKHLNTSMKTTNPNYRIQKELKSFIKDPPPNLSVKVGKNIRVWIVTMEGAKSTIYEGEVFKLRVSFPKEYPTMPPSVYFLPPNIPKHEHVYTNGDICLSLLGKDWRPTMTAQSIANSILSILSSAQSKSIPMDNSKHAQNKPGQYQQDWVYHDDSC